MNENRVEDNLQVIRTLMERTAVYRRALGPVMLMAGAVGIVAAVAGWFWQPDFIFYWVLVATGVGAIAFWLTRRQALKDGEPLWSPPARRVVKAMLPALAVGFILTGFIVAMRIRIGREGDEASMAPLWMMLYGCALHAAGFFAPRGLRLMGWIFILGGATLEGMDMWRLGGLAIFSAQDWHLVMGVFFGLLHLACGIYLVATAPKTDDR